MRVVSLDLFRFFAALAVVLFHYFSPADAEVPEYVKLIAQFGYLGVPLFFMISGYVIALSADNRSALKFAWARFLRLYPVYWLGVCFTVLIIILFTAREISLIHLFANLTMLNDYLGIPDIDGVYWTLHAELKFYGCVFGLMAIGLYPYFRVWLPIWLVCTIAFLSLSQPFFMSWFIDPYYSSYFIAGIAFFLIHKKKSKLFAYGVVGVSFVISCIQGIEQASEFLYRSSKLDLMIVLLIQTALFSLFCLLVNERLILKPRKIIEIAGLITYPLYLIHNIAGKIIIDRLTDFLSYPIAAIFVAILSIIISYFIVLLSDSLIVRPLRKLF